MRRDRRVWYFEHLNQFPVFEPYPSVDVENDPELQALLQEIQESLGLAEEPADLQEGFPEDPSAEQVVHSHLIDCSSGISPEPDHHSENIAHNPGENAVSATFKALGLDQLSSAVRIQLAGELLDSVTMTPGISLLTDAQCEEIKRRLGEPRDETLSGSP